MYKEEDLVRIAKRENNNKRKYLVVNRLQGKHIPVAPKEAFAMFRELADTLRDSYQEEKLLLIGFAETATAIGAAVAVELGTDYMQTTREVIPDVEYIFFSEEHSHATEQKLVKNDLDAVIDKIDRIVFVEDEVTTGKTILNIIQRLETLYSGKVKYAVASLLNGMDEGALSLYHEKDIRLHYLVKTQHDKYTEMAESFAGDGVYVPYRAKNNDTSEENCDVYNVEEIRVDAWMDARRLVSAKQYELACEKLWTGIEQGVHMETFRKVLVLGTEEFMYPALFVAKHLEQAGMEVACHATTRSPIAVSSEAAYPLHTRYELRSLYDRERVTYLYDIAAYDAVLVITDSHSEEREGQDSLIEAVRTQNETIFLVRWC